MDRSPETAPRTDPEAPPARELVHRPEPRPETPLQPLDDPPPPQPDREILPVSADDLPDLAPPPRELPPAVRPLVAPALAVLAAALASTDLGCAGILLTPLGLDRPQLLQLLGHPFGLSALLFLSPLYLIRVPHVARDHETHFRNRDALRKTAFLLVHWPFPLAALAALALGRELWDRMPLEEAVRSHRVFLWLVYILLVAFSAWANSQTAAPV